MGSERLPAVTKTLDFDTMKQGYLHHPLGFLNPWKLSVINSSKTFDYDKHTDKPSCQRVEYTCIAEAPVPAQPKMKKHQKKKRNKRRKGTKHPKEKTKVEPQGDMVDGCYSPKWVNIRCRLPSECESEDSFIVFDDSSDSNCVKIVCPDLDTDTEEHSDATCDSSPNKMVRFANAEQLCEVHPMVQWSYAYRKARKGPWEQYALDRMRFQSRIDNMKPVLDYVLQPAHRSQIYKDRFKE